MQYPFVTCDQEADRSEYTEEIIFHQLSEKTIHVCDRCSKLALVRATDAFSVGADVANSNADAFHKSMGELVAIRWTRPGTFSTWGISGSGAAAGAMRRSSTWNI